MEQLRGYKYIKKQDLSPDTYRLHILISDITFYIQDILELHKLYHNLLPSFIYLLLFIPLPFNLTKMISLSRLLSRARLAEVFLYMRPRPLWHQTSPLHLQVPARFLLPQPPTHRTFTSSLHRRKIPPTAKEERKARFSRFTLARLGWTLVVVLGGGGLFAGAELYLHQKKRRRCGKA